MCYCENCENWCSCWSRCVSILIRFHVRYIMLCTIYLFIYFFFLFTILAIVLLDFMKVSLHSFLWKWSSSQFSLHVMLPETNQSGDPHTIILFFTRRLVEQWSCCEDLKCCQFKHIYINSSKLRTQNSDNH